MVLPVALFIRRGCGISRMQGRPGRDIKHSNIGFCGGACSSLLSCGVWLSFSPCAWHTQEHLTNTVWCLVYELAGSVCGHACTTVAMSIRFFQHWLLSRMTPLIRGSRGGQTQQCAHHCTERISRPSSSQVRPEKMPGLSNMDMLNAA